MGYTYHIKKEEFSALFSANTLKKLIPVLLHWFSYVTHELHCWELRFPVKHIVKDLSENDN